MSRTSSTRPRTIVSWILAAQGVTLAATSLLVTVFAFTLAEFDG